MKVPLEQGEVNPEEPYNDCQAQLHNAALNGHEEVVKTLLERNKANLDKPDNNSTTLAGPLGVGMKDRRKCHSSGTSLTLTSQIRTATHRSCLPLGMDMKGR